MKIKKGDKVQIISGKDKGKAGKVLQVFTYRNKASVEGLNLLIKHMRPKMQGQKGQRIEFPAPLSISNLMLVCPKCGKPSRVGYKYVKVAKTNSVSIDQEDKEQKKKNKKIRICKKCQQVID